MKKIGAFLILTMVITLSPAWAIDGPVDKELAKAADHDSFGVKVPGMVLYGLYEIGESPLESLNQPYDQTVEKKDYALGFFKGINKGTYNFLEGMTRGIFDIVRSPVPGMGRYEHKEHQSQLIPGLGS